MLIQAAEVVGLPKHKSNAKEKNKETTTCVLISERNKICTQLENIHNLEGKDRGLTLEQLNCINDIQLLITKEEEEREQEVIKEINLNTKAFFDYANNKRKSTIKIGPLEQCNTFESGPQKMANVLSMQFLSVFY